MLDQKGKLRYTCCASRELQDTDSSKTTRSFNGGVLVRKWVVHMGTELFAAAAEMVSAILSKSGNTAARNFTLR